MDALRTALPQSLLPQSLLHRVRRRLAAGRREAIDFGSFAAAEPVSRQFGFDRGTPIDRYYIERFLAAHRADVRGRVLEVGDDSYTRRFGGDQVVRADILHVHAGNPLATVVGDLSAAGTLEEAAYDCMILTQTLHLIYDMPAAVREVHRGLKPGGVALVTVPGISQIAEDEWGANWFWSLTAASAKRLFEPVFGAGQVQVEAHGNVFAATAFLQGVAVEEVTRGKLDAYDPSYPVTITVRACRGGTVS